VKRPRGPFRSQPLLPNSRLALTVLHVRLPVRHGETDKDTQMPRRKAAKFKCEKCGKQFAMAMHLGRHRTTIHGQKRKKVAKRAARKSRRGGRPSGVVGRLGLRSMSLDQLVEVIAAAKAEAASRLTELQQAIR
jgi:hypothetical protein